MSALFQRNQSNQLASVVVERKLELRDVPFIYEAMPLLGSLPMTIIKNLYRQLSTNWLYSATLQLAFDAHQPPWSRDGWSFVPLDTQSLAAGRITQQSRTSLFQPMVNVTIQTPAIRARLDCTPSKGLENHTGWLSPRDITNSSIWSPDSIPKGLTEAYELGIDSIFGPELFRTSFLTYPAVIQCCSNGTDHSERGVALGYWSLDTIIDSFAPKPLDISVKWVHGYGMSGFRNVQYPGYTHLLFTEVPAMAAIRCTPIIEASEASVTVNGDSGEVQSFAILREPVKYEQAWSEVFLQRYSYNHSHRMSR